MEAFLKIHSNIKVTETRSTMLDFVLKILDFLYLVQLFVFNIIFKALLPPLIGPDHNRVCDSILWTAMFVSYNSKYITVQGGCVISSHFTT